MTSSCTCAVDITFWNFPKVPGFLMLRGHMPFLPTHPPTHDSFWIQLYKVRYSWNTEVLLMGVMTCRYIIHLLKWYMIWTIFWIPCYLLPTFASLISCVCNVKAIVSYSTTMEWKCVLLFASFVRKQWFYRNVRKRCKEHCISIVSSNNFTEHE